MSTESLFIVSSPRSGSTQLVQYVRQVPGCACYGEIFKRDTLSAELLKKLRDPDTAQQLFKTDMRAFWDYLVSYRPGKKIVGAKIFPKHLRNDPFWDYVLGDEPRIIYLWRANIFDTHISSLRSQASGLWQQKKTEDSPAPESVPGKVQFDTERYLKFRDAAQRDYRKLHRHLAGNPKALIIEYAEIGQPEALSQRFTEYFGVPVTLEATLRKLTSRPAIEYVENRADAEKFVADRLDEQHAQA